MGVECDDTATQLKVRRLSRNRDGKGEGIHMHKLAISALAVVLTPTVWLSHVAADTVSGKQFAAASSEEVSPLPNPDPGNPLLTATILKGRSKRALVIEAMVVDRSSALIFLRMGPSVNGVAVKPFANTAVPCDPSNGITACTASGVWWLDLDAAEAANPGVFIGQPLVVTLVGGDVITADGPGPGPYDASLVVRMIKK